MKHSPRLLVFVTLLTLTTPLLAKKKVDYIETLSLKETRKEWSIGVAFFSTENISLENQYLASSIPLKIFTTLLEYENHLLSPEEKIKYGERIIQQTQENLSKEAAELQKSLDLLDFEGMKKSIENPRRTKEWDILQKWEELDQKNQFLKDFSVEEIQFDHQRTIKMIQEGEGQQLLRPVVANRQRQVAKDKDADLLIYGQMEELAGYIYYRIYGYNYILDKIVFDVEGGGTPENMEDQVAEQLKDLITVVVGHSWSNLVIDATPMTASIKIDDFASGTGVYRNNSIEPGRYTLMVEAPGYIGEEIELILKPKETKTLTVALIRNTAPPMVINTFPPNADLYISSLWVGATPFLVEKGGVEEPIMVKKKGYLDLVSVLNPQEGGHMDFVLKSTAFNREDYLKQKRMDFYFNIAGLAVSIPMAILAGGYRDRFLNSIPEPTSTNAVQRQELIFGYKAMNTIFSVSIVLNIMMATGLIVDMIDYIKVYDSM